MKTLVGTPDPEDRDREQWESEFQSLDLKLAQVRAVMEQARGLSPRSFPSDLN